MAAAGGPVSGWRRGRIGEDFGKEVGEESFETLAGLHPDPFFAWVLGWWCEITAVGHDQENILQTLWDCFLL